jgi:hypothetical protein
MSQVPAYAEELRCYKCAKAKYIRPCICLINTNHSTITPPVVNFDVSWCSVDSLIVH